MSRFNLLKKVGASLGQRLRDEEEKAPLASLFTALHITGHGGCSWLLLQQPFPLCFHTQSSVLSSISHPVPKKRYQSTGTMVISLFICL